MGWPVWTVKRGRGAKGMNTGNIILMTDSYKLNHWNMYPPNTEHVYSYFESREGAFFPKTPFFGLQYLLQEYLCGRVISKSAIDEAEWVCKHHFNNGEYFNRPMWEHIVVAHGGRLPIKIKAVPEGVRVPVGNVLMTVENTDPKCFSLTNALESLLTHVWYPSTVCALSHEVKTLIGRYLNETSMSSSSLPFMLHDFGYRGVSSEESAALGGAAHLVNFLGTDTIAGMMCAMDNYGASPEDDLGFSVAATEHSIMTSLGASGEMKVLKHLLEKYPTGILSVVADSYDYYRFVGDYVGSVFKDLILERDGIFVVRPDSVTLAHNNPAKLVGWTLGCLGEKFGYEVNGKGYRVLNPKVRVIWGDGIDIKGIADILATAKDLQYSAENLVFGMGGGLLQKVNRDTQRFAFKSSAQCRDGEWHDVYKAPLDKSKSSKRGRLKLVMGDDGMETVSIADGRDDLLETVYENGVLRKRYTFAQVRENALK